MTDEYEQGQQDMLALIKDAYYRADKETFEQLLDAEDENEVQNFLRCDYIKQGMRIEIARLLKEEGYKAGLIALGTDNTIAVNPFGNRKDTVHIIYSIIENMNDKDKLILLAMILGVDLSK